MEVEQVLHMVGGEGESSYAANSSIQKIAMAKARSTVERALKSLCLSVDVFPERMAIADLGCSSGPNTLLAISVILATIGECCRQSRSSPPEVQFFLNDLPGNDFNTIFRSLPPFCKNLKHEFGTQAAMPFYVSGVPGSFYERIFPKNSVHFVHSSYSLHFLSQVPSGLQSEAADSVNKGNIYLGKTSPAVVVQYYLEQFQRDFRLFLKQRAEELVMGGHMVLVLLGRATLDPLGGECCYLWGTLAEALNDMVSQGLIKEEDLDKFNLPFYSPCLEEIEAAVRREGSFHLEATETFELNWDPMYETGHYKEPDDLTSGRNVAKHLRAVVEPILTTHFSKTVMDELFSRFAEKAASLPREKKKFFNIIVNLKKSII